MILVVRQDLGMGKGKIAAQVFTIYKKNLRTIVYYFTLPLPSSFGVQGATIVPAFEVGNNTRFALIKYRKSLNKRGLFFFLYKFLIFIQCNTVIIIVIFFVLTKCCHAAVDVYNKAKKKHPEVSTNIV